MVPSYKIFLERKLRNPLRKQELENKNEKPYDSPETLGGWMEYVRNSPIEEIDIPQLAEIRKNYDRLKKVLPPRAETYLVSEIRKYIDFLKRPSKKPYVKIYEYMGIQVFLDVKNVPLDFSPNTPNHRILAVSVRNFYNHVKDILPNRKPAFIITDIDKNEVVGDFAPAAGMQFNKTIFIDWRYYDDHLVLSHEYAHYLAELIPKDSARVLQKAFSEMLGLYYSKMKRKKVDPSQITDNVRKKIAKKLGFPEYGLTNQDEFFAVMVENWKDLPTNSMTYKFKTLAKRLINIL